MKIAEEYIVPVVRSTERDGQIYVERVHGTAFFINSRGVFITAAHVLRNATADMEENGGAIGLVMLRPGDTTHHYEGEILRFTFAPTPYDVAVGVVDQPSKACFELVPTGKIWIWQDVHTIGYPETAVALDAGKIHVRGHKGYVVRKLGQGSTLIHEHPEAFEVNFSIPKGMSGSPLVLRHDSNLVLGDEDNQEAAPPFLLIGVCTGNQPAELVDFVYETVEEDGSRFKEKKIRIEEYGIAHDLWSLRQWAPDCLGGQTLGAAIRPS